MSIRPGVPYYGSAPGNVSISDHPLILSLLLGRKDVKERSMKACTCTEKLGFWIYSKLNRTLLLIFISLCSKTDTRPFIGTLYKPNLCTVSSVTKDASEP